jgi:hypothetical protein
VCRSIGFISGILGFVNCIELNRIPHMEHGFHVRVIPGGE